MEIRRTIKATDEEMSRVFDYDEILNVKYCEKQKNGLFRVRFRIPECSLKDSSVPITLKKLKENVVKACSDTYRVIADVTYSDAIKSASKVLPKEPSSHKMQPFK